MRPDVTLIGLTTNKKVARQNALTWGTFMDVVMKFHRQLRWLTVPVK